MPITTSYITHNELQDPNLEPSITVYLYVNSKNPPTIDYTHYPQFTYDNTNKRFDCTSFILDVDPITFQSESEMDVTDILSSNTAITLLKNVNNVDGFETLTNQEKEFVFDVSTKVNNEYKNAFTIAGYASDGLFAEFEITLNIKNQDSSINKTEVLFKGKLRGIQSDLTTSKIFLVDGLIEARRIENTIGKKIYNEVIKFEDLFKMTGEDGSDWEGSLEERFNLNKVNEVTQWGLHHSPIIKPRRDTSGKNVFLEIQRINPYKSSKNLDKVGDENTNLHEIYNNFNYQPGNQIEKLFVDHDLSWRNFEVNYDQGSIEFESPPILDKDGSLWIKEYKTAYRYKSPAFLVKELFKELGYSDLSAIEDKTIDVFYPAGIDQKKYTKKVISKLGQISPLREGLNKGIKDKYYSSLEGLYYYISDDGIYKTDLNRINVKVLDSSQKPKELNSSGEWQDVSNTKLEKLKLQQLKTFLHKQECDSYGDPVAKGAIMRLVVSVKRNIEFTYDNPYNIPYPLTIPSDAGEQKDKAGGMVRGGDDKFFLPNRDKIFNWCYSPYDSFDNLRHNDKIGGFPTKNDFDESLIDINQKHVDNWWYTGNYNTHTFNNWKKDTIFELYYYDYRISDLYYEIDRRIYRKQWDTDKYLSEESLFDINHSAEQITPVKSKAYTSGIEIEGTGTTTITITYNSDSTNANHIKKHLVPTENDIIKVGANNYTVTASTTSGDVVTITHAENIAFSSTNTWSVSYPQKIHIYYDALTDDDSWHTAWSSESKRTPSKIRATYSVIEANGHKKGTPVEVKTRYIVTKSTDADDLVDVGIDIEQETFDPSKTKEFGFESSKNDFLKPFDHPYKDDGTLYVDTYGNPPVPRFIRRIFYGDSLTNNFHIIGEDDFSIPSSYPGFKVSKAKLIVFELTRTMEQRLTLDAIPSVPQLVDVPKIDASGGIPGVNKLDVATKFIGLNETGTKDKQASYEESGIETNRRIYIKDIEIGSQENSQKFLTNWTFQLSYWKLDDDIIKVYNSFYGGGRPRTLNPNIFNIAQKGTNPEEVGTRPSIDKYADFHNFRMAKESKKDEVPSIDQTRYVNSLRTRYQKKPILDSFIGADMIIEDNQIYVLYNDTIFNYFYNSSTESFETVDTNELTNFTGNKTNNIFFRLDRNYESFNEGGKTVHKKGYVPSEYMTDGVDIPQANLNANIEANAKLWGEKVSYAGDKNGRLLKKQSKHIRDYIHSFSNLSGEYEELEPSGNVEFNDYQNSFIYVGVGNLKNWYYRVSQVYGLNKVKGKNIFGFYSVNRDYNSKKTPPRRKYDEFGKVNYYRHEHDKTFEHRIEGSTSYHNFIDFDEYKEDLGAGIIEYTGTPNLRLSTSTMPTSKNQVYYDMLKEETEELETERDKPNNAWMKIGGFEANLIPLGMEKAGMIEDARFHTDVFSNNRGHASFGGDVTMAITNTGTERIYTPYKSKYFPYCFLNYERYNETTILSHAQIAKKSSFAPTVDLHNHFFHKFAGMSNDYRVSWKRLFYNMHWFTMHQRRSFANDFILPTLLPKTSCSVGDEIIHLIGNQGEYNTTESVIPVFDLYARDQTRHEFGTRHDYITKEDMQDYNSSQDSSDLWESNINAQWEEDEDGKLFMNFETMQDGEKESLADLDINGDGRVFNPIKMTIYGRSYKSEGIADFNTQDMHGNIMITPANYGISLQFGNPLRYENEIMSLPHNLSPQNIYKDFSSKPLVLKNETTGSDAIHFICGKSIGHKILLKEKITKSNNQIYQKEKWSDPLNSSRLYDQNNFMWTTIDDVLYPRIPIANFSNMTIYDAIQSMAKIMGYTFGIENGKPFFKDRDQYHYHENPDPTTTDTRSYFSGQETAGTVAGEDLTYDFIRNWDFNPLTGHGGTDKFNNKYWFWDGEIFYLSNLADKHTIVDVDYIKAIRKIKNSTVHPNKFKDFIDAGGSATQNTLLLPHGVVDINEDAEIRPKHIRNSLLYEVKSIMDEEMIIDINEYQRVYDSNYTDIHATYGDGKIIRRKIQDSTEETKNIYTLTIPYIDNKQWVDWLIQRTSRFLSIDRYKIVLVTKIVPSLKGGDYIAVYNDQKQFNIGSTHVQGRVFHLFRVSSSTHDLTNFTSTTTAFSVDTSSQYVTYNSSRTGIS